MASARPATSSSGPSWTTASAPYPSARSRESCERAAAGVADAHNLAWKLALVHRGPAGPGLLETYAAERRPTAELTVEQADTRYVLRVDPSLGQDDIQPSIDDPSIELGAMHRSRAVLAESVVDPPLENPRDEV